MSGDQRSRPVEVTAGQTGQSVREKGLRNRREKAVKERGGRRSRLIIREGQQDLAAAIAPAEVELKTLNDKITCLLHRLDNVHVTEARAEENECVVCLVSRATIQTFPCRHSLICQRCIVKTIQVAVETRQLPLKCVLCRERITSLRHLPAGKSGSSNSSNSRQKENGGENDCLQFPFYGGKRTLWLLSCISKMKRCEERKEDTTPSSSDVVVAASTCPQRRRSRSASSAMTSASKFLPRPPLPPPRCDRCDRGGPDDVVRTLSDDNDDDDD